MIRPLKNCGRQANCLIRGFRWIMTTKTRRQFCCRIWPSLKKCSAGPAIARHRRIAKRSKRQGAGRCETHAAVDGFDSHRAVFDFASGSHRHGATSRCSRFGKVWRGTNGRTRNSPNLTRNWPGWISWRITNWPCAVNWCCSGWHIDYLRRHPEQISNLFSDGDNSRSMPSGANIALHLIPSGWFYQNQLRCARTHGGILFAAGGCGPANVSPAAVRARIHSRSRNQTSQPLTTLLRECCCPRLGTAAKRFAYGQESVDLARVADCAGALPARAWRNIPNRSTRSRRSSSTKVPHDIINGQPLHYRRTADGQFVLYSVGWNETDDGGEVGLTKDGAVDISTGDWVWRYPAK